jgi:hypothetical protein
MIRAILLALLFASPAFATPARPSGPGATFTANGATIWYEVRGSGSGRPLSW